MLVAQRGRADRVFHLRLLRGHPEAFIEMRVEDLDPLLLEAQDNLFALRALVLPPRIQPLAAAPDHEQVWLVRTPCVDQAVGEPVRAGQLPLLGRGQRQQARGEGT